MQRIVDSKDDQNELFTFTKSTLETDEQLIDIMHDEKRNSKLFNLSQGLVFRCHLVHHKQISSSDLLIDKDLIIFNFHHALFDFPSMNVFFDDLNQAYKTGQLLTNHDTALRYLDCECEYLLFSVQIISHLLHIQMLLSNKKCQ
jgi:hypothetical protein